MTTATLPTRSMAFSSAQRPPLLQRVWAAMMAAGARRAQAELQRQAAMRRHAQPGLSRQLADAARSITV